MGKGLAEGLLRYLKSGGKFQSAGADSAFLTDVALGG